MGRGGGREEGRREEEGGEEGGGREKEGEREGGRKRKEVFISQEELL